MDEELEPRVPVYYVVNRHLPENQSGPILQALGITPVCCSVISDLRDSVMAFQFSPEVVRASDDEQALAVAKMIQAQTKRPPLVLGEAKMLDAVYADGKRETVVTEC